MSSPRDITMQQWLAQPGHAVRATRAIHDVGAFASRGDVGAICDYLPLDGDEGYVVVDFSATGPTLCTPDEIEPA